MTTTAHVMRLHGATVIDDDFSHTNAEVSGSILLRAGMHPILLTHSGIVHERAVAPIFRAGHNETARSLERVLCAVLQQLQRHAAGLR